MAKEQSATWVNLHLYMDRALLCVLLEITASPLLHFWENL